MPDTLTIRPATASDLDQVWALFEASCALQTPQDPGPDWHLGVYPSRADFEAHAAAGDLYVGVEDGRVLASMIVTAHEDEEYLDVAWQRQVPADKVSVIHLLAVHPQARGRGLAGQMLEASFGIARTYGCEVIHLDVTVGNHAARRAYEKAGFSFTGQYQLFYEDTGLMDFWMLECAV